MAKESVKARQRKREKMVAKFAEKRAALKEAGDYAALDLLTKTCRILPARLFYTRNHSVKRHITEHNS